MQMKSEKLNKQRLINLTTTLMLQTDEIKKSDWEVLE